MIWIAIITIIVSVLSVVVNVLLIFKFGPVSAARLSRDLQREGTLRDRKLDLFKRLAATRGSRLTADHVLALNLVPIEFNKVPEVIAAWRTYLEHLNFPVPKDEAAQQEFFHEQAKRLMALIMVIAADLDITFDRMDIQNYAYTPQQWVDDDFDARVVRKLSLALLQGLKPLNVALVVPPGSGPFPPAPTVKSPDTGV